MNIKTLINEAYNNNVKLMGDDFIGYKFVGEKAQYWNELMLKIYNEDEDTTLTYSKLKLNDITPLEYDSIIWNKTI